MISGNIANGIGLAREAYAHHRASSRSPSPQPQDRDHAQASAPAPAYTSSSKLHPSTAAAAPGAAGLVDANDSADEAAWQLDDVQAQLDSRGRPTLSSTNTAAPADYTGGVPLFSDAQTEEDLINEFKHRYALPASPPAYTEKEDGPLPYAVCLPQRRPRHRTRGFVRAYAPVLEGCGVSQDMFMDFLAGFEKAIEMHQVFNAVQVVVKGTDIALQVAFGPNLPLHIAFWCVHAGIETGRRQYVKYSTNKYLDEMNVQFFRPRGLYALIMCYKPSEISSNSTLSLQSDSITKAVSHRSDGDGPKTSSASGTTRSELELPEAAPLIFPELDAVDEENKPNVVKRAGGFLGDYYDRRAQAKFEFDNPNSKLNVGPPRQEWASRYSDPTSAAASGGLVGLISGGKIKGLRYRRKQRKREQRIAEGKPGGKPRMLSEDMFYLLIVNFPTEDEIQEAKQTLLREEGGF